MCGIFGVIGRYVSDLDHHLLEGVNRNAAHRGPDDWGWLGITAEGVHRGRDLPPQRFNSMVLLHRRLAIIDLSDAGWQPMASPDGRHYIVFNGEIYNYLELRSELIALGRQFHSQSDTEVLLAAYLEWGQACLGKLIGMFAFAIVDLQDRRLFLARDPFGIKPLYLVRKEDYLAFGSEIKYLLGMPDIRRHADPRATYQYLRYGLTDHASTTMFAEVEQVPAAHWLEASFDHPEQTRIERYWSINLEQQQTLTFDDAAFRLRQLFLKSVKLHLRSDVPVGAALSGGIDSSAIVCAMRYLQGRDLDLHTFSYIAKGSPQNEEKWADLVVDATGATQHKIEIHPDDLVHDLDALIASQDEPFGSTTIYAQRRVFQAAKDAGIIVMLDGQGADEILAGYRYFVAARGASMLRQRSLRGAWSMVGASAVAMGIPSRSLWMETGAFITPDRFQSSMRNLLGRDSMPDWLNRRWFADRGVQPEVWSVHGGDRVMQSHLWRALSETSLPHLLRYEDRNSMAFSLESRVPFLTVELAEFMLTLPEEYLVDAQGLTKAVFRRAMKGIVPQEILNRRDKIGFATPESAWLTQGSWVQHALSGWSSDFAGPINLSELRSGTKVKSMTTQMVWRAVNLLAWMRIYGVTYDSV